MRGEAMRFGKVDLNQAEIVDALRKVGVSVQSLASLGKGVPDLIAAKGAQCWLIEVKGPKGKPTPDQVKWVEAWKGDVHFVRTVDDALKLVGVIE
jgi:Holliday junction resolvase